MMQSFLKILMSTVSLYTQRTHTVYLLQS